MATTRPLRGNKLLLNPQEIPEEKQTQTPVSEEENEKENSQPMSIHKIDLTKVQYSIKQEIQIIDLKGIDVVIAKIIYIYNQTIKDPHTPEYKKLDIRDPDWSGDTGFHLCVYRQIIPTKSALNTYLQNLGAEPCVTSRVNHLFFYYRFSEKGSEIFALSVGKDAWRVVHRWSDFKFPIKLARRLLAPPDKKSKRMLVGNVLTVDEILKEGEAHSPEDLAVLFQRIQCKIKSTSSLCALPNFHTKKDKAPIRGMAVEVGLSLFRFNKRLLPDAFPPILDHLARIDRGDPTVQFNPKNETSLSESDSEEFDFLEYLQPVSIEKIGSLNQALEELLWETVKNEKELSLDFCHRYSSDYFQANDFSLNYQNREVSTWEGRISTQEMIEKLKTIPEIKDGKDVEEFRKHLSKVTVSFKRQNKKEIAPFRDYLEGEFHLPTGSAYWRVRTVWFEVSADYLGEVHRAFGEFLKGTLIEVGKTGHLTRKWPSKEQAEARKKELTEAHKKSCKAKKNCKHKVKYNIEAEYNEAHLNDKGFILGDRICPQNIEIFDLLFFDDKNVFLYHVKEGFGQKTRDACSQIINAAKLISAALKNKGSTNILKDFYTKATEYEGEDDTYRSKVKKRLQEICKNEADFLALFKRKIVFVYAVIDDAAGYRELSREKQLNTRISLDDIKKISNKKVQENADKIFKNLQEEDYIDRKGRLTSKFLLTPKKDFKLPVVKIENQRTAIVDHLNSCRSSFDSLIAKLELRRVKIELEKEGFQLKICQIRRNDYPDSSPSQTLPSTPASLPSLPLPKPPAYSKELEEGKTFTWNEQQWRICETLADGACGLHALWGLKAANGVYQYLNPDFDPLEEGQTEENRQDARNYYLWLLEKEIKSNGTDKIISILQNHFYNAVLTTPSREARLIFHDLKAYKVCLDRLEKIAKKHETRAALQDPLFLELLNTLPAILPLLKATSKEYADINDDEVKQLLLKDAKKRKNAFCADMNPILDATKRNGAGKQLKQIQDQLLALENEREEVISTCIHDEDVLKSYKTAILNPRYFFTEAEIGLAAILSGIKVQILAYEILDRFHVLSPQGVGEEVVIFHKGVHFSRCVAQKK